MFINSELSEKIWILTTLFIVFLNLIILICVSHYDVNDNSVNSDLESYQDCMTISDQNC